MQFYKAKYDAANPMRQQLNVPTNTDFMVGTELYVKGEKKEISPSNCTIYTGETETVTEEHSGSYATPVGQFIVGDPVTITVTDGLVGKTISPYVSEAWIEVDGIKYMVPDEMLSGVLFYITSSDDYVATEVDGKLVWRRQTDAADFDYITVPDYLLGMLTELTQAQVTAMGIDSTVQQKMEANGYTSGATFIGETREVPVTISADTTVNGIPAFTMKSLDAEADKLYDVEFKKEGDVFDVSLSASGDIFQFVSDANSYVNYTTTQDIEIVAPVYGNGADAKTTDNPTYLKDIRPSTGKDWFDGSVAPAYAVQNLIQFIVDGVTYSVRPVPKSEVDSLGLKIKGSSYFVIYNGSTFENIEKLEVPAEATVRFRKSAAITDKELYSGLVQFGESYDYRFKLFINEDELAYGDVQVGQEFENTITLSGTYEDDTTFSYTIPVVED